MRDQAKLTEQDIKAGHPSDAIPGAVWLGNVYGEDDDWRIYAVPIRSPNQRYVEATTDEATVIRTTSDRENDTHG